MVDGATMMQQGCNDLKIPLLVEKEKGKWWRCQKDGTRLETS